MIFEMFMSRILILALFHFPTTMRDENSIPVLHRLLPSALGGLSSVNFLFPRYKTI